jgi:hypothetical protein
VSADAGARSKGEPAHARGLEVLHRRCEQRVRRVDPVSALAVGGQMPVPRRPRPRPPSRERPPFPARRTVARTTRARTPSNPRSRGGGRADRTSRPNHRAMTVGRRRDRRRPCAGRGARSADGERSPGSRARARAPPRSAP